DGMLCKHHFSKNGQVFFHIFWVVTLIMQSRYQTCLYRQTDIVLMPSHHPLCLIAFKIEVSRTLCKQLTRLLSQTMLALSHLKTAGGASDFGSTNALKRRNFDVITTYSR
ncbi:hypothetical protein EFP34_14940, partial [Lacticaseibacillus paracasei]|nr:hypothetical protein [Lacticaseibacillus paracasei]